MTNKSRVPTTLSAGSDCVQLIVESGDLMRSFFEDLLHNSSYLAPPLPFGERVDRVSRLYRLEDDEQLVHVWLVSQQAFAAVDAEKSCDGYEDTSKKQADHNDDSDKRQQFGAESTVGVSL